MKKIEQKVPNVTKATIAACVLHNICISLNDEYDGDESDSDGDDSSDDGGDFEPASDMRNAMKDCGIIFRMQRFHVLYENSFYTCCSSQFRVLMLVK